MRLITRKQINSWLLFPFLLVCVFFPADPYNIKIAILMVLLVVNAQVIVANIGMEKYRPIVLFGLLYPIIIMAQSILLTGDIGSAISGAYCPIILILLIPIIEDGYDYRRTLFFLLKVMAVSVLLIAAADLAGFYNVNGHDFIRNSFYSLGMGVMGKSAAYSSYYRIFYKASPLLVLLLDDSISRQKLPWVAISFAALWFTGTRANVFSALIILFFRYVVWNDKKTVVRFLIAFFMLLGAAFAFSRLVQMIVNQMTTSGAVSSDLVRSGEITAYMKVFSKPAKLLFGTGFGSKFFNIGRDAYDTTSELSYFEMIRCVGLILSIPFFCFVFRPIFSRRIKADYKLSFICYLIIAATNPLLFSSTAMLMYMFLYEDIVRSWQPKYPLDEPEAVF